MKKKKHEINYNKYKVIILMYYFHSSHSNQRFIPIPHNSKVKGTLEVYHAYITDSTSTTTTTTAAVNGDDSVTDSSSWELVDQPSPTSNDSPVAQSTEVTY